MLCGWGWRLKATRNTPVVKGQVLLFHFSGELSAVHSRGQNVECWMLRAGSQFWAEMRTRTQGPDGSDAGTHVNVLLTVTAPRNG